MSKNTGIEWADDTVNPTSGCDGCELWIPGQGGPCYAGNLHQTRLAKSLPLLYDPDFTNVRLIPGRMVKALRCMSLVGKERRGEHPKPWLDGLPRLVFVGDLGDIFSKDVPFEFLKAEIIDLATVPPGNHHIVQMLTKQPQRAAQFATWLAEQGVNWPNNVWIGTSITSRASVPRIRHLRSIPAKHRFLSLEPLVGDPGLSPEMVDGVDWMIIGGESDQGPLKARPFDPQWARDTIALGQRTGAAVFVKQLGSSPVGLSLIDHHGGDWDEWPVDLRVRQMPVAG
jgi:protein gp37